MGSVRIPAILALLHFAAKVDTSAPDYGNCGKRSLNRKVLGFMKKLAFEDQWPGRKGREIHINLLELETFWKEFQQFREEIKGKVVSFQKDNMVAFVPYVEGEQHSLQETE